MTPQRPVDSYWAKTAGPEPTGIGGLAGDRTVGAAVIGGSYTGLSAAGSRRSFPRNILTNARRMIA